LEIFNRGLPRTAAKLNFDFVRTIHLNEVALGRQGERRYRNIGLAAHAGLTNDYPVAIRCV